MRQVLEVEGVQMEIGGNTHFVQHGQERIQLPAQFASNAPTFTIKRGGSITIYCREFRVEIAVKPLRVLHIVRADELPGACSLEEWGLHRAPLRTEDDDGLDARILALNIL